MSDEQLEVLFKAELAHNLAGALRALYNQGFNDGAASTVAPATPSPNP